MWKEGSGTDQEEQREKKVPREPLQEVQPEISKDTQELRRAPGYDDQIAPAIPEPQVGDLPLTIRRIHAELRDKVEPQKLHLKQYHMATARLKRRAHALRLLEDISRNCEEVCGRCEAGSSLAPPPAGSRVSGLRAQEFGPRFTSRGKQA